MLPRRDGAAMIDRQHHLLERGFNPARDDRQKFPSQFPLDVVEHWERHVPDEIREMGVHEWT